MGKVFSICVSQQQTQNYQQLKTIKIQKIKVDKVQEVDIQKSKLKQIRDKIQVFINKKNSEVQELDKEMKQKYVKNKNKKDLLPLLETKKQLLTIIDGGQLRLRTITKTIRDIETQQMDVDTINVLDDSNKYMAKVQQQLQDKNWRSIVEDAKNKYETIQWEQQQEDESFKQLWRQLGGDAVEKNLIIPQTAKKVRVVEIKQQKNNIIAQQI